MRIAKLVFFAPLLVVVAAPAIDLTIFGFPVISDGLGSIPFRLAKLLHPPYSINFVNTRPASPHDFDSASPEIQQILEASYEQIGAISIMTDALAFWDRRIERLIRKSAIKICYSMFETSKIPLQWVKILNTHFDYVLVPDVFLHQVYKASGVKIPIFVLPLPMDLATFLSYPVKRAPQVPFVFGNSASFTHRKNNQLLLESFAQEFGNNEQVVLKLHGRYKGSKAFQELVETIDKLGLKNVHIIDKVFSADEYQAFLASLDCYVLLSKGEGYSLTPREAMALGIPCILSDNSAQKTLCATGLVYKVPANIPEPARYEDQKLSVGNFYTCKKEDVCRALKDVYEHYQEYLDKAERARIRVACYDYTILGAWYTTLLRPQRIVLSYRNVIIPDTLMTDNAALFLKYINLNKKIMHGIGNPLEYVCSYPQETPSDKAFK